MQNEFGRVQAVFQELKNAMQHLRQTGETYTIYVENTGLTMEEQVEVLETLGLGDVTIHLKDTDQPVEWYESTIRGVWIGTFRNGRDEAILYTIEVCRYPTLAGAYDEDIISGEEDLQEWIEAAQL